MDGSPGPATTTTTRTTAVSRAIVATFVLRFATGLTGGLLIYLLADFPAYGGPAVGAGTIGALTALFFAGELMLSPFFGLLSDRRGYRAVMQLGPVFGLVAVVLTMLVLRTGAVTGGVALPMLVGSLPLLGLTRVLEGASTAASVPSVLGYLALASSGDEALRGRASARFEAATIAGLGLGLAAAGPAWSWAGPGGLLANALVYAGSLALFRWGVPATASEPRGPWRRRGGLRRYRRLLRRVRVWLLAPTWVALNAAIGLYTSQTLFQLVRSPDPRFSDQALVGGLDPLLATAVFAVGGAAFFAGLLFWGRYFTSARRTTIILYGLGGAALFVVSAGVLNHLPADAAWLRLTGAGGLLAGVFLLAGATPAALGLLADMSESFPQDRGAVMGLYSVFLGVGQIIGAVVGAVAAELWALDGILVATLALAGIALLPISRLRAFELRFQPTPGSGPDLEAISIDLSVTRAYRREPGEGEG